MKMTRKDFLRLSGLGLLALAGKKVVSAVGEATAPVAAAVGKKVRWGMAVDLKKWREGGAERSIAACTAAHNIPQIPEHGKEVRWLWEEPFEKVFPSEGSEYARGIYAGSATPVMCNHCAYARPAPPGSASRTASS
jgi:hypothetical protein